MTIDICYYVGDVDERQQQCQHPYQDQNQKNQNQMNNNNVNDITVVEEQRGDIEEDSYDNTSTVDDNSTMNTNTAGETKENDDKDKDNNSNGDLQQQQQRQRQRQPLHKIKNDVESNKNNYKNNKEAEEVLTGIIPTLIVNVNQNTTTFFPFFNALLKKGENDNDDDDNEDDCNNNNNNVRCGVTTTTTTNNNNNNDHLSNKSRMIRDVSAGIYLYLIYFTAGTVPTKILNPKHNRIESSLQID